MKLLVQAHLYDGKNINHNATLIQVKGQRGAMMKLTTQDAVEQSICTEIHEKQYTLAGKAPICNSKFFQDFGCTANTPASQAVLDGTYVAPKDSDLTIKELFAETAAIRQLIPENSVSIIITRKQWKQYWKVVNKETSSLESGLHFGHYIVGFKSDIISHYHAA